MIKGKPDTIDTVVKALIKSVEIATNAADNVYADAYIVAEKEHDDTHAVVKAALSDPVYKACNLAIDLLFEVVEMLKSSIESDKQPIH